MQKVLSFLAVLPLAIASGSACGVGSVGSGGAGVSSGASTTTSATSTATSSSSSMTGGAGGGGCTVDPSCAVKWGADIFNGIFDISATGCTSTSGLCHGTGKGNITLEPGKPHEAYLAVTEYMLAATPGPVKPYIVPCDPAASGILCNAKPESGMTNPFGACGSLMPLVGTAITAAQLNLIADWIACGAPEN